MKIIKTILIFIIPFSLLILLGTWQLFRLNWKNNLIKSMNDNPSLFIESNINNLKYKPIIVNGTFNKNKFFYVYSGNNNNYYVLQPMYLDTGSYILINRGTISSKTKENKILNLLEHKSITISGILYCDLHKKIGWFIKNDKKNNSWFWFDIKNMSKELGLDLPYCVVWSYQSLNDNINPNKKLILRNDHLQYAITWYSLSVIFVIFFYLKLKSLKYTKINKQK